MTKYWELKVNLEGLRDTQKSMLFHDIGYYKWEMLDKATIFLNNLKGQRGWRAKIVSLARKNKIVDIILDQIENNLDFLAWKQFESIMKYEIKHEEDKTILTFAISTDLFEVWERLKGSNFVFTMMQNPMDLPTREGIRKRFEHNIRSIYTKKYNMEEREYEADVQQS